MAGGSDRSDGLGNSPEADSAGRIPDGQHARRTGAAETVAGRRERLGVPAICLPIERAAAYGRHHPSLLYESVRSHARPVGTLYAGPATRLVAPGRRPGTTTPVRSQLGRGEVLLPMVERAR